VVRTLPLGIRGKIAAVILICMVPVLLLGAVFYHDRNQERRRLVLDAQAQLARGLASDVSTFVANAVHTEREAGAAVTSQPYPVVGIVQLFAAIRRSDPAFRALALVLPDGRVEAGDPPLVQGGSVADHAPFRAVRRGAEWAIGHPVWTAGHPEVELVTGIRLGGRLVAAVDGRVDLGSLPALRPAILPPATDGVVVDGAGRVVLALGTASLRSLGDLPAVREALAGRTAIVEGVRDPRTGQRKLGAAAPIPELGWAAVVLEPESSALEPVRRAASQELLWILAYAGLGLFLAWVLGGELSAPILALARGARAIGRGSVGYQVALRRRDELGELAQAFDEMSERLARHISEMNAVQAVSDAALSTVRLGELLPTLLGQIVAAMRVDDGAIWFVDEVTGDLVAPGGTDPGGEAGRGVRRLRRDQGLAGRVVASGRPVTVSRVEAFPDVAGPRVHAAVAVPLRAGGRVIGAIEVVSRRPREFEPREVRLLETFADRVALAVDNARAYERQQEIAGIIQRALLSPPDLQVPGLAVAGRYRPSREVGGDFYAVLPLEGQRVGLAIADVSGTGIAAATLSAKTRYLLEALALDGRPPEAVLAQVNAVLARDAGEGMFVSVFYGLLDVGSGGLLFASAGHPPPFLLSPLADAARALEAPGILLGVDPRAEYAARHVRLHPGDVLLLYTDGITEARSASGELFGEHRLLSAAREAGTATPQAIAAGVMEAVRRWSAGGPCDDQAVVVARFQPASAPEGEASRERSA
jgi:sigma-B regulation protein RsbU (phosphoserine phosphatase)